MRAAVIIPTLLGGHLLDLCLAALNRQTWRDFEVLIVDNSCTGLQIDSSAFDYPLRVLRPGANIGFGAAINMALNATAAGMIATLNDDTEVDPQWLEALMRQMVSGPRVGMCASKIRFFESSLLDSAGMNICLDGNSKQRGGLLFASKFTESDEVLFPSACAALYRRVMLDEIGAFDRDFFLYCEDTDLGLRALWAGWRCRYAAEAGVRHHYSATSRTCRDMKARYVERNRIWVALKTFPSALLLILPFASLARYLWLLWSISTGSGTAGEFVRSGLSLRSAFAVVARAHLDTLANLPELLRKRRLIFRTRKTGVMEFTRLLLRHRITARELART